MEKIDHDASQDSIDEMCAGQAGVKSQAKLIEEKWTNDMKLPLYFRKMFKIDRFNKKEEVLFFTDTKFKKYKESLICIDCYLKIVSYLQTNQNHGTNIYDRDESNKKGSELN